MEAKSVLVKFREQRKLLENLRESMATPRLKGMWNFLYRQTETQTIIFRIPPVNHIVAKANPGKPVEAETYEEVVGIGLYIMRQCSETKKHITEIIHDLGIGRRDPKPTRQSYVDDVMSGYINPALDFIETKLEELGKTKEKPTAPRKSRVKDVGLSDKTADELTIEEASIAAYSIPDQPTDHDALGFEPYTTAISEFLSHEETKPPLTISVEGEWGSGKSSFMLQLIEKLKKEDALIVKFSPWRHEKEESVWAAFVLTFSEQLAEELGFFNSINSYYKLLWERFNWREGWPKLIKFAIKCFAYFIILIGVIIVLWAGWIPYIEDVSRKVFVSIFGAAAVIWQVLKKSSEVIGNPFKHDLKKYIQTPDYTSRIPFIEKFHKDFKKIVETYAGDKRVYVFIDDLDRCEVPKATDLLQAINLMISDEPQLVFIVGMDRQKVAAGLAVKHKELFQYLYPPRIGDGAGQLAGTDYMSGLRYGYSFIEKFIQLPFSIPQPKESDIENLIDKISETPQGKKVESQSGIDGATETVGVNKNIEEDLEAEKVREQRRETLRLKLAGDSPKIQEIVLIKTLMNLIEYCPDKESKESDSLEFQKYTLLHLDVKKLLEISPKVSRVEIPPEQETYTTKEKDKAFYSELLDRIKEKHPEIKRKKALPQSWLTLPIGHAYIHLEWAFHGRPRSWFEVGLHFEKAKKEENEKLIKYFKSIRDELEEELGGIKLEFQTDWGIRWARIYASKQGGEMTDELKDWAVETALKFYDVFKPRLDKFIRSKKGARVAEREEELRKKLKMPVEELALSMRVKNCFESIRLETVGQLVKMRATDLLKIVNFGKASLLEVKRELAEIGLSLGMTDV